MDSNPGPQSQSHTHNGQTTTLSKNGSTAPPPQSMDIDMSTPPPQPKPLRTTYEYQPVQTTPTPSSPSKRASEAKAAESFQSFKRLRVTDEAAPTPVKAPAPSPSPKPERPTIERNSSLRFDKPAPARHVRSRSLPATLRSRKTRPLRDSNAAQHNPPVTLATLRELNLDEIYRNPKLRHDVVFDSQLHFRPNLDGSRGRRKKEQSDMYWKMVLRECEMLFVNLRNRQPNAAANVQKLPVLFKTMKDILLTLVPKSDQQEVEDSLDSPLLMQQLEHGVLDFKKLASWLASVLKAHCAPMRDSWVEQMVQRISYGVDTGRTHAFVDGLKIVFGILEAMKLDVANHQIRTLRPHLVSTAVQFEQQYWQDRIDSGRLDMTIPRSWYHTAALAHSNETDPYIIFVRAATKMLTPSEETRFPQTWAFDLERLESLRDDVREAISLKVALLYFRQATVSTRRDVTAADNNRLKDGILAILSEEEGAFRWSRGSDAVALHLAQAAHQFAGNVGIVKPEQAKLAQSWLANNLKPTSHVYKLVERNIMNEITNEVLRTMRSWASMSTSPIMQAADFAGSSVEVEAISQRISYISFLHWRIFGHNYSVAQPVQA